METAASIIADIIGIIIVILLVSMGVFSMGFPSCSREEKINIDTSTPLKADASFGRAWCVFCEDTTDHCVGSSNIYQCLKCKAQTKPK